jgi:hypothetical protein
MNKKENYMAKSDAQVLEVLKRFKAELRDIDFDDPKKQQKYGRLRSYLDALMQLLQS